MGFPMCFETTIEVNNVTKSYDIYNRPNDRLKEIFFGRKKKYKSEFTAVSNVSLDIKKGDVLGILGRNGSGKSTLLQMICGTIKPSSGDVEIRGRVAALLELGSGFNPDFSGRENVYLNASLLGLSKKQIDENYNSIIEFSGIPDEFISQPIRNYSSGMVVRLAFSVIAHVDADILVIDEALSVGDAYFVQRCMRFLRDFMKKGTIVFVSHDTSAVLSLCNRAVLMEHGQMLLDGTPKDVVECYLAKLYGSENESKKTIKNNEKINSEDYIDQRLKFINSTNLRNDIEVSLFSDETKSFGVGGVEVIDVKLLDENNDPLSWVVGGETITLSISCSTSIALDKPIIGFQLKDKLGQVIIADNTFVRFVNSAVCFSAGEKFECKFTFRFPIIPAGSYSVGVAVANGEQENHIQHLWIHDALILNVNHSSVVHGLVGIPMKNISLKSVVE